MLARPKREKASVSYREPSESDVYASRGSLYNGAAEDSGSRRSYRPKGKDLPLDALAGLNISVPGATADLTYSLGGADTGGIEAERILREVEIDDNAIELRMQFSSGRRVVLSNRRRPVAAAVVEFHAAESLFEIPILAAGKAMRQQGNGSLLVALLMELACKLGARILVVSATDESRRFWLRQGLHAAAHCEPQVAAELRALAQKGARYGFFETTQMARALPVTAPPSGSLVASALEHACKRCPAGQGLTAAKAAEIIGYEDLPPGGGFVLSADGCSRQTLEHDASEMRINVQYGRLQVCHRQGRS